MARNTRIPDHVLARLRALPLVGAVQSLGVYAKRDPSYVPRADASSERWYFSLDTGATFEVIVTGARWYDVQSGVGQAGAIDLVMHLLSVPLPEAVKRLKGVGW
jgi:hypothetical protein